MNRYPWWKNLLIACVLLFGLVYTLPNFFGTSPALQISSASSVGKVEASLQEQIKKSLTDAKINFDEVLFEETPQTSTIRIRFNNTDTQIKARDVLQKTLNPTPNQTNYVIAFSSLTETPKALQAIGARPMSLGLDLRGGVYFLLQVDMEAAKEKRIDRLATSLKSQLANDKIQTLATRDGQNILLAFRSPEELDQASAIIKKRFFDVDISKSSNSNNLVVSLNATALANLKDTALEQNIITLHNRINALGVTEPIIQRQGDNRIVLQLAGIQDTAQAKQLIGRTATLEVRLEDTTGSSITSREYRRRTGGTVMLKSDIIWTGDSLKSAQAGVDQQMQPIVSLELDNDAARTFKQVTRDNIHKGMAIVMVEKNAAEAISVATIQSELSNNFQISGLQEKEARELALLLNAGSLAAPMDIIEERTIGPSLGAENISMGFNAVLYGFIAISIFMTLYYLLFGAFSVFALGANVLLLLAVLSGIQATLTLPGIAAIALALGMAIDANVLVNERIREELRRGIGPQTAISEGYSHAWATIIDSNVTTLIVGIALMICPGAVRGFAIVHCLGILTSMFSAVLVSRALVNLWYGRRKKLDKLAIGQIWQANKTKHIAK
jgi:preprotein translocase subunit SecD